MHAVDEFLFCKADLPCYGKEWYYFVLSPNKGEQAVYWLLRSQMKTQGSAHKEIDSAWFYKNQTLTELGRAPSHMKTAKGIRISNDARTFELRGSYPHYAIRLTHEGSVLLEGRTKQAYAKSAELSNSRVLAFNTRVYNDVLNFSGTFLEDNVESHIIIQKAVVNGPFLPWRWSRLSFEDGSVLGFSKIPIPKLKRDFANYAYFYDATDYKTHDLGCVSVEQSPKQWQIQSKNLELILEPYAKQLTTFEARGSFSYEVNLVRTKEVLIKNRTITRSTRDLGTGYGPFENANGFVL
ncbi:hypothetical protein COT72_04520 [archaeon CG10_big_fil_rev_8_21_14_0_10_43_11]|nr:MAG: hypothetical protein COT72_04520 [archaeon CG10_big_fil_rev_8_21_14_0_10_43_11]